MKLELNERYLSVEKTGASLELITKVIFEILTTLQKSETFQLRLKGFSQGEALSIDVELCNKIKQGYLSVAPVLAEFEVGHYVVQRTTYTNTIRAGTILEE